MARATWLADVLRAEGLHVVELPGWKTRETRPGFDPAGLVLHHTATPKSASDENVRRLLRDGRSDLSGPLCQLGLERDGTYVCVAAGRANHAGFGSPWGNDSIGIEAYNDGRGEPWPPAQMDAWRRGCAAICRHLGWGPLLRVKGHREVDPGRKIDPTGVDLNRFRHDVQSLVTPPPLPLPLEDDMLIVRGNDSTRPARLIAGPVASLISRDDRVELEKRGVVSVVLDDTSYDRLKDQVDKVFG